MYNLDTIAQSLNDLDINDISSESAFGIQLSVAKTLKQELDGMTEYQLFETIIKLDLRGLDNFDSYCKPNFGKFSHTDSMVLNQTFNKVKQIKS